MRGDSGVSSSFVSSRGFNDTDSSLLLELLLELLELELELGLSLIQGLYWLTLSTLPLLCVC